MDYIAQLNLLLSEVINLSFLWIFDTGPRSATIYCSQKRKLLTNINPFHPMNPKWIIVCVRVCVPGPAHIIYLERTCMYPGSQAPFLGEEVTSSAIVGSNTNLVRLCHPFEGLGGLLTKFFSRDG